jgi:hypothetical protein
MPLAAILGVSLLLALPPLGEVLPAHSPVTAQSAQTQQDSQASSSQQPPAAGAQESGKNSSSPGAQGQGKSETPGEQPPAPANSAQQPEGAKPASSVASPKASAPKSAAQEPTAHKTKKHRHKHPKNAQAHPEPSKVVVPNGGASDPSVQLAPSLTRQQAADQRQDTNQLLASTESNLKAIAGHPLQASQRDMVRQIEQYVAQAKAATKAGDLERAHNLALKAQLLSKELVKH